MLIWKVPRTLRHWIRSFTTAWVVRAEMLGGGDGGVGRLANAFVTCRVITLKASPRFTVEGKSTVSSPA